MTEAATWPPGASEMARRVRELDWAATGLGPSDAWPKSLRAIVNLLLPAGFPMIALWGPDLIQIYNDDYRALMGNKHPSGLGQPTRECWPEVWDINAPIYERVRNGETLTFADKLYPITRSGRLEDAWFTLSYSPLRDEAETIAGVLVAVHETTDRVRESAARDAAEAICQASEERYRAFVTASSDVVYRMSPDWLQMRELDGQGFLADTSEPTEGWMKSYILPDDRSMIEQAINQSINTRSMFELEHRVVRADGTTGWTQSRAVPILSHEGEITEWLGAAKDITVRRDAEEALRESEQHQRLLLAELQHRVRNTLAVVRSIARRTAENSSTVEEMLAHFQGRLDAFSRVQAALTRNPNSLVNLMLLVEDELVAHAAREGERVKISGPDIMLEPRTAERLSLAIHELTTNAVKHGALSGKRGGVIVEWSSDDRRLDLSWKESGVDVRHPPKRSGFGMELLLQTLPFDLQAETNVNWRREGVEFCLKVPLKPLQPGGNG